MSSCIPSRQSSTLSWQVMEDVDPISNRKVFLFTAPRFKTDQITLTKGKCFNWKISQFNFDPCLAKSEKTQIQAPSSNIGSSDSQASRNELQEISEINLDYELEQVRDTLLVYLDDTFTENSRETATTQPFVSHAYPANTKCPVANGSHFNTAQEEYDIAFGQSQKLLEESQGFTEISLSDEIQPIGNSVEDPIESESLSANSSEGFSTNNLTFRPVFTKLSECTQHGGKVNIFAVVLQVNPIKEVQVKSGVNSGCYVNVSSVLVADPSKEYFKLTFWRKAADWVTKLVAGNVIVVKKLKIDQWNDEFYGQNTFETTIVNLGQGTASKIPPNWLMFVDKTQAKALVRWLETRHPYIAVQQQKVVPCEVKWQTLAQLKANSLAHYRAKIVKVLTYNSLKGNYSFGSKTANKVMALAIDPDTSKEIPICLWGHQADWRYELKSKIGQIWDFKFLRVECKSVYGDLILHTTLESTKCPVQELNVPCSRPIEDQPCTFLKLSNLLKANFNGKVAVSVNVVKMICSNSVLSIDRASDSESVCQFWSQLIYLGCKACFLPLTQDHNGIYIHCNTCRRKHTSYSFGVIYCYKECKIQLSDTSAAIIATSSHNSTVNFIKDFDVQDILERRVDKELFDHMSNVFSSSECKAKVTLCCETTLDENGFVQRQAFELIDLEIQ